MRRPRKTFIFLAVAAVVSAVGPLTKIELSGSFDDPDVHVWNAVGLFIRNAFFKAVVPGFEGAAGLPGNALSAGGSPS